MNRIFPAGALGLCFITTMLQAQAPLFENAAFRLFANQVEQGKYVAYARQATEMVSNYQSPANAFQSATIQFKFALNAKDNEMPPGVDHMFTVMPGQAQTPVIVFGQQMKQVKEAAGYLAPNQPLRIRLDMRPVLQQFKEKGYYTTFKGERIYQQDFKGVYVAGSTLPMFWDFDNIANKPQLQLKDADGDGIYETSLVLNNTADQKQIDARWKQQHHLEAYPQYTSPHVLADAIYRMSMDEMVNAIEPDSTLRTGKEWAGVWTRDVSYSIILAMAHLQPQVAMKSLMRKVNARKRIIQDTGTGGAWPASTDRMIWAVAAWEIYLAHGSEAWLKEVYPIIKNSLEDDELVAYDTATGLVKGESSFLDWREQTYPKWMQPADIFESQCLGTNAVHYKANEVLASMASLLNEPIVAAKHNAIAAGIKAAINKYLWMPDKKYYAQFRYGRQYKMVSPRSEALGEALCVLWNITSDEQARQLVHNTPVGLFGIPCIHPQIPNQPPYHNNGVWPFVQAYWAWAAAGAGNATSVMESVAAIYRSAAMFATNKENYVAENGDYSGTVINSSNMLWSLSGNISLVHHVLFGIRFHQAGLAFEPFVPKALGGERRLQQFAYRQAVLDITIKGYGKRISKFLLDGKDGQPYVPAGLQGAHRIEIVLDNDEGPLLATNQQPVTFSPAAPLPTYEAGKIHWAPVDKAIHYVVYKNGREWIRIRDVSLAVEETETLTEYQIAAVDAAGITSFASEPIGIVQAEGQWQFQAEQFAEPARQYPYAGYSGEGFVETSHAVNPVLQFSINVPEDGWYAVDFRYSNGNGPVNTENKCAIRTLSVDGALCGAIVLPQRGSGEWSAWGYTNSLPVRLKKGKQTIALTLEPFNENMHGQINQAMIDLMRVMKK